MGWHTRKDNKKHYRSAPRHVMAASNNEPINPILSARQVSETTKYRPDEVAKSLDPIDKRMVKLIYDEGGEVDRDHFFEMLGFDEGFRLGRFTNLKPILLTERKVKSGRFSRKVVVALTPFGIDVAKRLKNVSRVIGT